MSQEKPPKIKKTSSYAKNHQEKLARVLKENLLKRKQQQRLRKTPEHQPPREDQ